MNLYESIHTATLLHWLLGMPLSDGRRIPREEAERAARWLSAEAGRTLPRTPGPDDVTRRWPSGTAGLMGESLSPAAAIAITSDPYAN